MASALCSCYEEKKLSKQRKRIRRGSGGFFFNWHSQEGQSKREKETGKQYHGSSLAAQSREHFLCVPSCSISFATITFGSCPSETFLGGQCCLFGCFALRMPNI